ncbi:MAG: hypothetical protein H6738_25555 [Alphaproteobacteria bacterium]|nr:hypothetical protein [Alphaproteobacteria bacterium]MCB9700181.1 hypothetical protein [Alphaproteobacteria bacterium]
MLRLLPFLVVAACAAAPAAPDTLPAPTVAALRAGDCNLCHAVPGVESPATDASCSGCHLWIRDVSRDAPRRKVAMETFPYWERYERNVHSYMEVPSLEVAMARLEPRWVERWLQDPHDVRTRMGEGMPRFGFGPTEAAAIAKGFAVRNVPVAKTPKPDRKNVEAGRAKMLTAGCPACHNLGGALVASPGVPSAPDLAFTRDRMDPDRVVAWIEDPKAISPMASMPSFGVSHDDAILMRDFIFLADPGWTEPADDLPPVEALGRPVAWAEVEERVFGKICAHCHMDPALPQNQGRTGPGNGGGFGWPATGIHLQSPEAIRPHADAIVPALLRRRAEARRDRVRPGERPATLTRPEKPGMPLGLPPLEDEEIALVMAWIAQGLPE